LGFMGRSQQLLLKFGGYIMSCCKCDKKAYVNYKDKNYCTWYCAKKG